MRRFKTSGSMMIIAGTTIGAGMLALPLTSAKAGFLPSVGLLIGMWILMSYTALVTLEVNLHYQKGTSIALMAQKVLGPVGRWIASFALMMLFYALLSAYISGATSILDAWANSDLKKDIPQWIFSVSFTGIFAIFVGIHTRAVDYGNRFLFIIMIVLLGVMSFALAPQCKIETLKDARLQRLDSLWLAVPIFFTSFGFHGSIPSLIDYIGRNPKKLRRVFLIGSLLPLIVYLIWQAITMGVLPLKGSMSFEHAFTEGNDVGTFVNDLADISGKGWISGCVNGFTLLAIITSFLGVGLGLFDFLMEIRNTRDLSLKNRFVTAALTVAPPLFFALFYPKGFILALGYAAIALSLLAVVIPCSAALYLRHRKDTGPYTVWGGNALLWLAWLLGLGIIGLEATHLWF